MDGTWISILVASVVGLVFIYLRRLACRDYPPGPAGIPILGNLHQMGSEPHKTFLKLGAKYGDVFSFQFGSYRGVILNGHKTIKEALSLPAFNGRHMDTAAFPREGGIGPSEGRAWIEQRRFAVKTLRDFGLGKKSTESLILNETQELIDRFKENAGKPQDLRLVFNVTVLNSLWTMLTGWRFNHDDPRFRKLISTLMDSSIQAEKIPLLVKLSFFISWLRPLKKYLTLSRDHIEFANGTIQMMKDIVDERKKTPSRDEAGDFIDAYLREIEKTTDPTSSFWREKGEGNLHVSLFDLFLGGTETTASTLMYGLQYLAIHQDIQEKLFREIERVIGLSRFPALDDRPKAPYVEATINEILRISTLLPRSLPHRTTETVRFKGYTIPEDTMVVPNLYSALHDPQIWGDPENFRPERFLNAEGELSRHHEGLLPFSTGKRICPGESFARDQLFLILCSLVQRFKFKPDPNSPPLKVEYSVTPLILAPKPKLLMLEERL